MKPTLEMEKPQQPAMVIVQQPEQTTSEKKSYTKRWVIAIVLGLVTVVIVAAVVLVSVHLAVNVTRDNYKEAMVTFHDAENNRKLREKIVVTDTEEDIEVPDKMRIIYDFKKHLAVVQFDDADGEDDAVCYVTKFNVTTDKELDQIRDEITGDEIDRSVTVDPRKYVYESTGEQVALHMLSPRAQDMCRGHPVYWAKETIENEDAKLRRKRGCYWRCSYSCAWFWCRNWCFLHCSW